MPKNKYTERQMKILQELTGNSLDYQQLIYDTANEIHKKIKDEEDILSILIDLYELVRDKKIKLRNKISKNFYKIICKDGHSHYSSSCVSNELVRVVAENKGEKILDDFTHLIGELK